MDKTTMILNNGDRIEAYYPDDYRTGPNTWQNVSEIEIRPEDIEPGTMSSLCRDIFRSLREGNQEAV